MFFGQSRTVLWAAMPGGWSALKESGPPPIRILYCHQRLDGVDCWVDVVGARRDHPDNRAKEPHFTTEVPNLAYLCNVVRGGVIGKDGPQMVLDRCTRISLAAIVSDEVAILFELGRHCRSVLLVPGDENLLV